MQSFANPHFFRRIDRTRFERQTMSSLLILVVLVVVFGGGGGYYALGRYGGAGLGGVLGTVLIILLGIWLVGGI
jgi:hypothetical protein